MRSSQTRLILVAALTLTTIGSAGAREAWLGNGNPVCVAPQNQTCVHVAAGPAEGFFAVWADDRGAGSVFAQRMGFSGAPFWDPDGVSLSDYPSEQLCPACVADATGGLVVVWADMRGGAQADIYAQRVDIQGIPIWKRQGVPVSTGPADQCYPSVCEDGEGGAIVVWWDDRGGDGYGLYAQRLDGAGEIGWTPGGVAVCGSSRFRSTFLRPAVAIAPDGRGGVVLAWEDYRSSEIESDIYAQRLDAQGATLWPADGVVVCSAPSGQWAPSIVPDGSGGAIVAWHDFRGGPESDIFAQRIDASGERRFGSAGVSVCAAPDRQFDPAVVADGAGGALVAWIDLRSGSGHDIRAQRIDSTGSALWIADGVSLGADARNQPVSAMAVDDAGGAILAWHESRGGSDTDVYAQRVSAEGTMLWGDGGIAVCAAPGDQKRVAIARDRQGGAVLAWEDFRFGVGADIFAQRVLADGGVVGTLLQGHEETVRDGSVVLSWRLAEELPETSFEITRAAADGVSPFEPLAGPIRRSGSTYSFVDTSVEPGGAYLYRVFRSTAEGPVELFETAVVRVPEAALSILPNHPNPTNGSTVIAYELSNAGRIELSVYSCRGELVARLFSGNQERGSHVAVWNGRGRNGAPAASGIYFCALKSKRGIVTVKIVRVR